MSISHYRNAEPLYLVIVRETNAQQLLQAWAKSANVQVTIENNRMKVFDTRTFNLFHVGWPNSWNNVTIWDYWLKRHIQVPDNWKDS